MWSYQRVFPLLDGMFQDVVSTQLKALTLDPNAGNGNQVDAIVQNAQIQVGYSQLAQAQNQSSIQMLQSNVAAQSSLLQQQSSITAQLVGAEQTLVQAQAAAGRDTLAQPNNKDLLAQDADAVTQAQTNVKALNDTLTQIGTQIKAAAFTPAAATGAIANGTTAPSGVPSGLVPSSNSNTPSFPTTKQMDNQIQLLWERLGRIVASMVKPDSARDGDQIYFVHFDLGIFPVDRKGRLLDVNFPMTCQGADGSYAGPKPIVLDMFPKVAALNLSETKYRDKQFSIATALSWLGFGVNSSFYRDHLKLSQVLGQSSYITGRGIGQSQFGWRFGISLGDEEISAETRNTFALISVPRDCTPSFGGASIQWIRRDMKPADHWWSSRDEKSNGDAFGASAASALAEAYENTLETGEDSNRNQSLNPLFKRVDVERVRSGNSTDVTVELVLRSISAKSVTTGFTGNTALTKVADESSLTRHTWTATSTSTLKVRLADTDFDANGFYLHFLTPTREIAFPRDISLRCPIMTSQGSRVTPPLTEDGQADCDQSLKNLAKGNNIRSSTSMVESVRFSRIASTSGSSIVPVTLILRKDLDQQTVITADGVLLKRTRDFFTRAVSGSNLNGLLESQTVSANTWMMLNSRTIILSLDSAGFGQHFPNIILSSPAGATDLSVDLSQAQSCPEIRISGLNVARPASYSARYSCLSLLPSLTYKGVTLRNVSAIRVLKGLGDDRSRVVFTDLAGTTTQTTAASTDSAPQIQVSSDLQQSSWGQRAEVYQTNSSGNLLKLECEPPSGSRLKCIIPSADKYEDTLYHVIDQNHHVDTSGAPGTLEAWTTLPACDESSQTKCALPTFWQLDTDVNDDETGWDLNFQFVNVAKSVAVTSVLLNPSLNSGPITQQNDQDTVTTPLKLSIQSLKLLKDSMKVTVVATNGKNQSISVSNLLGHLSPIADANVDWTKFSGTNLLSGYKSLRVGNGQEHAIVCISQSQCSMSPDNLDKDETGFISLLDANKVAIPLRQVVNGKITLASYTKKAAQAPNPGGGSSSGGSGGVVINNTIMSGAAELSPNTTVTQTQKQ
jgi:hypothetical protein